MRFLVVTALTGLITVGGISGSVQAAGCLKGAAVGGIAGHMAGHGVLGAAAGCAVGHHEASKDQEARQAAQAQRDRDYGHTTDTR